MALIKTDCGQCDTCKHIWVHEHFTQLCECCGGMFCKSHLKQHGIYFGNVFEIAKIWVCDQCIVIPEVDSTTGQRQDILYLGQPIELEAVVKSKIAISNTALKSLTEANLERVNGLNSDLRKRFNKHIGGR